MDRNVDFFSKFDVSVHTAKMSDKVLFVLKNSRSLCEYPADDISVHDYHESLTNLIDFYKKVEAVYTFTYKKNHMFTVSVTEPHNSHGVLHELESSLEVECFGKYGFKYFIGDILSILRQELYAHLMEVAWHPNRVQDWCFEYNQQTFTNDLDKLKI